MVQPFDVAWQRTDGLDAVHELTDGRLVATERDCHPDSIAEAFRRRITVLELQQIIGRGRGLWRTADNPLHVLVLTDVPLDMPVEELTTDAAERPSFEDRQIAVGAIAFECAAHAAKANGTCVGVAFAAVVHQHAHAAHPSYQIAIAGGAGHVAPSTSGFRC